MNIPNKVLRSTFLNYETYFHHQQLAKKYYKASSKQKTKVADSSKIEYDQISYVEAKPNFKEEILKWYYIILIF